ncbi:MAG: 2-C-methyl-D-erythritol 4-phosphate cytidylyltransferase [Clostridia bacterium]|nr:2-C-methyl-D-erythritol 4-phosphate cytidylyltransferase [Clostridia bacterium]
MSKKSLLHKISDALMNKKHTTALILAAGSGERFSKASGSLAGVKKQFVSVLGEPILLRTVKAFEESALINDIIVVSAEDDVDYCRKLLEGKVTKLRGIIPGGATRQESAKAGLEAIDPKSEFIAIHDGARCLVTVDIIENTLKLAYETGAAAAAERAVDTVKYGSEAGIIEKTIDRDHVWLMKTPQIFLANMYRAGVYSAERDGASVTDDCMLVERIGFKVHAVDCGHENIKITYPTDKIIAEAILTARMEAEMSEET